MKLAMISRRTMVGFPFALAVPSSSRGVGCLPIHKLNLPEPVMADVKKAAETALQQARWLEELPLEEVPPGFVFLPR